jgi:rRNA-processing protein EBP2
MGKNKKYGFGGGKKHSKSNTKESTDDISSFSMNKMKAGARGRVGKKSRK